MNPRVAERGTSFKGAGQYYLHDKDADTNERVEFTHTENLITDDPEKAVKCMAWTAMHQMDLKRNAGMSLRGNHGCKKPVYSYSLAWHPEQDPTKEHMIDAANASLEFLGLHEHEALMVAHNDTEHPHIHVIVNLVHPVNGNTAKYRDDYKRFSRWAQAYQEERGETYSPQRVENNRRRDQGEFVKYDQSNLYDWRRKRQAENFERRLRQREDLTEAQKGQHIELNRAKERLIEQEQVETREESRKDWRELYKKQEKERARIQHEQQIQKSELDAVLKDKSGKVLREPDNKRTGFLSRYFKNIASKTIPDKPRKVKEKQVRERHSAQKSRADDLNKLTQDKYALRRETPQRTGRLARFFGDKTNRSKQDVELDEVEKAAKRHLRRLSDQKDNDLALRQFLKNKKTLRLDDKKRTGKLSKSFTSRAGDDRPTGALKSTRQQRLLNQLEKAKKAGRAEKKAETRKRRGGQAARRNDLKKTLSDKGVLRRVEDRTGKLSRVYGDHANRSKEDIAHDKQQAINRDRQDRGVKRRDDDHDLKRSLQNPDRLDFDAHDRTGKLSKSFSGRAQDKDMSGDRKGPDHILSHPLSGPEQKNKSANSGLDDNTRSWTFADPKTGKRTTVPIGKKEAPLSDDLIARREKRQEEAAEIENKKSRTPDQHSKPPLSDSEQLDKQHDNQRKALGKKINDRQKAKIKKITELYNEQLAKLKKGQQLERDQLADQHSRDSQKGARGVKDGRDVEEFDRENKYTAFRDMRDEVTRDHDRDNDGPDRSRKTPKGPSRDK